MQRFRRARLIVFVWAALAGWSEAPGSAEKQIVTTPNDSIPGKAFEIVGRVKERTANPGLTESDEHLVERSSQRLANKAREMGADAVLGVHGLPADPDFHPRWVSGVAVRFIEPGESASRNRARFITSVLPIEIPDSLVKKAKERSQLADAMRDQAQSAIEPQGYYAHRNGIAIADSSELLTMSDSLWKANFGAWTDNVLCVRFAASHTSSNPLQVRRETSVEAWMYSRTLGHIVWRSEAIGTGTNWGFHDPHALNPFQPKEVVLEKSLQNAVSRVLKDIPAASD